MRTSAGEDKWKAVSNGININIISISSAATEMLSVFSQLKRIIVTCSLKWFYCKVVEVKCPTKIQSFNGLIFPVIKFSVSGGSPVIFL